MARNEEYIENAFNIFYKVMDNIHSWGESELKANITELNIKHLLDNLDKALVQVFNEDVEGEINNANNRINDNMV